MLLSKPVKILKSLFSNLLLMAVSLLLALAVAEFVLRHYYPSIGTSFHNRIPHPTWGWSLDPGVEYINYLPEADIKVKYNADGWRDVDHPFVKSADEFRVLVLGDSFMEGYSVNFEQSFHRVLGNRLKQTHANSTAINLGVGGFGTFQEYLVYQDVGQKYSPDLLLLGFCLGNDLSDNSPAFRNKNSAIKSNRPYLISFKNDDWEVFQPSFQDALERFRKNRELLSFKLAESSALSRAFISARKRLKAQVLGAKDSDPGNINAHNFGMHFCQESDKYAAAWETTNEILRKLNETIIGRGGKLVVFSVPSLQEVDTELMHQIEAHTSGPEQVCLDNPPGYRNLRESLQKLQIEYVDLLPAFRQISSGEGRKLFRLSDRHWNEAGHELAAQEIYSYLKVRELLKQ